jgi:eukaryotic-like serine/threonine-protein kinase
MTEQVLRLFVSSPGDVAGERRRIDLVVERLNAEFVGRVRIETVRWELSYYSAHDTFQRQIPEAAECDVVVAVFRGRLGTPLPEAFPRLPSGEPYPSGTAYEILSAMEVRRAGKRVPDVYVFRYPDAPSVGLDAPDRAETEAQWGRLKQFFDTWFRTQSGEFLAAFQTYISTDDFAVKVEDCLRQWLTQRGFLAQGPVWDRVLHGSPFPGLAAFDADRGRVFFGRDMAIGQALDRLRDAERTGRAPFLLVIGASGSGKSSLLRAGLLPQLVLPGTIPEVDAWRIAVMTPGPEPFAALAEALFTDAALGAELRAGTFRTREMLAKQMAGDPEIALAPLRDALDRVAVRRQLEAGFDTPRPARLALGIDQAERLFTEAPPEVTAKLAWLLAAMVRQRLASVVVVLRSDAYAAFQGNEAMVALREDGATLDLVPPSAAELEEIVTRPVAVCHPALAFEQRDGRSLAALLVADARGGDALPLLQVSLARLYAAEAGRGDGLLRFADYSGMDTAVTQTANEALATLDAAARAELPALVAGLVADVATDPRTGALLPVVVALDRHGFETSPARAALVAAFVAKRLLTAEGDGARPLVRPVHEALLRIWPEAVAIVAETAALLRVRHTLTPLVRAWSEADEASRPSHLDLSPALLDGAQGLLARFGADLSDDMRAFIAEAAATDAARRDRERVEQERRIRDAEALAAARRRTARRTMAGLAAAVVLAVLAGWQWHEAGQQRDRAQRSLNLATQTANSLVLDLSLKLRNTVGVPIATIRDILDQAGHLQDQLLASGEENSDLRGSQATALLVKAHTLAELGDTAGALATGEKAQGIVQYLANVYPDNFAAAAGLALCELAVADIEAVRGDLPAARASYQAAVAINQRLAQADPADTVIKQTLDNALEEIGRFEDQQGELDAAAAHFKPALETAIVLAAAAPGDAYASRMESALDGDIGDVALAQGDTTSAQSAFEAGRAVNARIIASQPGNSMFQTDHMVFDRRAGWLAFFHGNLQQSLDGYQAELAVAECLVAGDPANVVKRAQLATAHADVGIVQLASGDAAAALASHEAALTIREALAKLDPDNVIAATNVRASLRLTGDAHRTMGDHATALAQYRAALGNAATDAAASTGVGPQRNLWLTYERLGELQAEQKDFPVALESFQQASAIAGKLGAAATSSPYEWRHDLATLNEKIAAAQQALGSSTGEAK